MSPRTVADRPEVLRVLRDLVVDQSAMSVAWRQRAMANRPDSTAVLAAAELPVLVVVGADDALTPPAQAREMAAGARQLTLREIPGTGHLAVAEDPGAVAAAITGWWRGTRE